MSTAERISKYELLECLGGGMSLVYRARDTSLNRIVAIKILSLTDAGETAKLRFLQEARVASEIRHPNIPEVYDFGEENGSLYIVMEFLPGRTLRTAIQNNLIPDTLGKLRIALQVAQALLHIHQHRITHRDVKPENVQIGDSGLAKLLDFGVSKIAGISLTQPGYVPGTPCSMAPEQVMGAPVTASTDIYGFGIMLYEMLAGKRPYYGESIGILLYRIIYEKLDVEPLRQGHVPAVVCELVAACTAKKPAARPHSVADICTALKKAIVQMERTATLIEVQALAARLPLVQTVSPWVLPHRSPFHKTILAMLGLMLAAGQVYSFCALRKNCVAAAVSSVAPVPVRKDASGVSRAVSAARDAAAVGQPALEPEPASYLEIHPNRVMFAYQAGAALGPHPMMVSVSASDGSIGFTVRSNIPWLRVGRRDAVTPAALVVAVLPAGLRIGMHCGTVEISPNEDLSTYGSDLYETLAVCVNVSARPFVPPRAAILPEPESPEPPSITESLPVNVAQLLAPAAPPPAVAKHLHLLGRRPGKIVVAANSILLTEEKGHEFESSLNNVAVDCRPGKTECLITVPQASSGHRERIAVAVNVGMQLHGYLSSTERASRKRNLKRE